MDFIAGIKKWFDAKTIKEKWFISLMAFSLLATGALFTLSDTTRVAENPLDAGAFYFIGAFFKTIVVLLLIFGASIFLRNWAQPGMAGKNEKQMRVVETIRLSPKQTLHLVVIGNQQLLIGATDQTIALIAPVENRAAPFEKETLPPAGLDFSAMIHNMTRESISQHER